jgi:tRNA-splicing ligase RtcB
MIVVKTEGSVPIKAWVGRAGSTIINGELKILPDIEDSAMSQLENTAKLPFIHKNGLAVMPDVHGGIGSTVGSVIATKGAIIPAAVGVDIGCGMNAIRLSLKASDLPDSLRNIRLQIERDVPLGQAGHNLDEPNTKARFFSRFMADSIQWDMAEQTFGYITKGHSITSLHNKAAQQLGSLGGGNHFIELCLDEADNVWVMLHSGSRGIGNIIGSHFIKEAKEEMERYFIQLPDNNLAYVPEGSAQFQRYIDGMMWAQDYALQNRAVMMELVLEALARHIPTKWNVTSEAINCHHNYATRENHFGENLWITRKGAVSAREGQLGIIPGARGAKSYIVRGKGNKESYCSCSHGAGRVMSRTAARATFSHQDLIDQSAGVECSTDKALIDEIKGAYKDIDVVMENQKDLVGIKHTLRAVLNVKGT